MRFFSDFKRTYFRGGFLKRDIVLKNSSLISYSNLPTNYVDPKFLAPRKIDNRDMCLLSDNQGDTPFCAAYSTAGYIEFQNWKILHYPVQTDAKLIYKKAKELEKNDDDGTSFDFTVQAVNELNLFKGKFKYIYPRILDVKFAIHQYGVCLGAFIITDEWNYVSTKTGLISKISNHNILGSHGVLISGYDNNGIYIQNSWGDSWGVHGFAILSWEQFSIQFMNGVVIEP
jgi:hypothetical protein